MKNLKIVKSPITPAVSPAGIKVLGLLQKGCAYHVRGSWRFRGLRDQVREQTLLSLLQVGLAERVETDRHAQVRITPAGRSINDESERAWHHAPGDAKPH